MGYFESEQFMNERRGKTKPHEGYRYVWKRGYIISTYTIKMKFKLLPYLVLCLITLSCWASFGIISTPGPEISDIKAVTGNFKPRFDGAYSLESDTINKWGEPCEKNFVYSPLIFVNDSNFFWSNYSAGSDSTIIKLDFYTSNPYSLSRKLGYFVQQGDTLFLKTAIRLYRRGNRVVYHEAYFKGTMLNNDTIVDWHMVPQYPNEDVKVNNNFEFFTQPNYCIS